MDIDIEKILSSRNADGKIYYSDMRLLLGDEMPTELIYKIRDVLQELYDKSQPDSK